MWKIKDNKAEFNLINQAAKDDDKTGATDRYCDIVKHCKEELYAIPLINNILISFNLPFITEEWLSTDLVEKLPVEWIWDFVERPLRVIIPLNLQAKSLLSAASETGDKYDWLGQILGAVYTTFSDYILINGVNIVSYQEEIYSNHLTVLQMFDEIIIEVYNDPDIDKSLNKQLSDFTIKV
jgi:hypothetical protein